MFACVNRLSCEHLSACVIIGLKNDHATWCAPSKVREGLNSSRKNGNRTRLISFVEGAQDLVNSFH